jgi:hypothetical protein
MSPPGTKSTVGLWASSAGDRALSLRIAPKVILARLQLQQRQAGKKSYLPTRPRLLRLPLLGLYAAAAISTPCWLQRRHGHAACGVITSLSLSTYASDVYAGTKKSLT